MTDYDILPYPNYTFTQTHPDRLAAIARVFDVNSAPPESANVLEIGCARGSNILPMAESLPNASFLGIDSSPVQVEAAKKDLNATGLSNAEFICKDLRDVGDRKFDYIISHGVFSWVDSETQESIFSICEKNLKPGGVVYISYNTNPGWKTRSTIREMLLYHIDRSASPKAVVQQSRAFLRFLAETTNNKNDPYSLVLQRESEMIRQMPDGYFFHDHLEQENNPLYFHEFVERAAKHDLQYLADADLSTMTARDFSPETQDTLRVLSSGQLTRMEQYLDFLRNRPFRCSLLVRNGFAINRKVEVTAIQRLYVSANLEVADEDFKRPDGVTISVRSSSAQNLVKKVARLWPSRLPVSELSPGEQREALDLIFSGVLGINTLPSPAAAVMGELPLSSSVARVQASYSSVVSNLAHELVSLSPLAREVLKQCNGAMSLTGIQENIRGKLKSPTAGDKNQKLSISEREIAGALEELLRKALLK